MPEKVVGKNLKLFGYLRDGSYVLTDDLKDITIAYSFGIDGDIAFDMKIADEGIDVYMYDPYIFKLSFPNFKCLIQARITILKMILIILKINFIF